MRRRYGRRAVLSSAEGAGSISDLRRRRVRLGWGERRRVEAALVRRPDRARGGRERGRGRCCARTRANAPETPAGLAAVLAALMVLPLLARHRLAFAAPAAVWLLAAAVSFVDGRLVPFAAGINAAGLAAAFLLGQVPDARAAARPGWRSCSAAPRSWSLNDPTHSGAELRLPPGRVRARLAGRLRPARARRPGRGGRGARARPSASARRPPHRGGRGARADRARAARHRRPRGQRDGAPGRRRPPPAPGRATTPRRCATSRRPAAPRSPRCAACSARCAATTRTPSSGPSRASPRSSRCSTRSAAPACRCGCRSTATPRRCRAGSTSPPTGSSRRA